MGFGQLKNVLSGRKWKTAIGLSGKYEMCKVLGRHMAGVMDLGKTTVLNKAVMSSGGSA